MSAETKLIEVCRAVSLPTFMQTEIRFLKTYIEVMQLSLDILQGDQHCTLWSLLPTITVLKTKLMNISKACTPNPCRTHLESIQSCIPSSTQGERLFSAASLVGAYRRRNILRGTLFKTLLMLKINKHCW